MSNPVSNGLPAALDSFLQDFAQSTGKISYADIAALGRAWPVMAEEKKNTVLELATRIETACAESMPDPGEAMGSDGAVTGAADALARIVTSSVVPMAAAAARAAELEKELAAAIDEAKAAIEADTASVSVPGVNKITKNAFTVSAKDLGESWDPAYYDVDRQKELVHEKLSKACTLSQLRNALRIMLSDRKLVLHPLVKNVLSAALDGIGRE